MAKRLSNEQILNCLKLWQEYRNMEAQTLLIISNTGLVKIIAKKYQNQGILLDELESAGFEGLVKAINMFDYINKPIEGFSTYISVAIENEIRKEFRNYNKHNHVLSFDAPAGHNENGEEIKIKDKIGTDENQLLNSVMDKMKMEFVRETLKSLTQKQQQIILLRYGLNEQPRKTQEEVAQIFGISRQRVSIQERKALIKMRMPD